MEFRETVETVVPVLSVTLNPKLKLGETEKMRSTKSPKGIFIKPNQMTREFESTWWSIELLAGWRVEQEDVCTAISSEEGIGVLQVSAYHNAREEVSEKDLSEFSEGDYPEGVIVLEHKFGAFRGLHVSFPENGTYWRKWWLRKDSLLLFVTYNCSVENQNREYAAVDQMVAALKPKAPAA